MTPARLEELRTALAALAKTPLVTPEAHTKISDQGRRDGISLGAHSPLAKSLTNLVADAATTAQSASKVAASGEVLYRMVVPAKVAAQVGGGLVRPTASRAVAGGVRGALVNGKNIVGQAILVPVAGAVGAGALTLAAPLVLMAVAAGYSAYTDHKRDKALERITGLLEKLHEDKLDEERSRLEGCKDSIEKATAVLLDRGEPGVSLGLDTSVHEINVAIERAHRRLHSWQEALAKIRGPVEVGVLEKSFPGVTSKDGGEFRAHLEHAKLAIALKRRVLVLQAVEHAQLEGADHPFRAFIETLKETERRVNDLEAGVVAVLRGLATLEVKRYGGIRSIYFSQGEAGRRSPQRGVPVTGYQRGGRRPRAAGRCRNRHRTHGGRLDHCVPSAVRLAPHQCFVLWIRALCGRGPHDAVCQHRQTMSAIVAIMPTGDSPAVRDQGEPLGGLRMATLRHPRPPRSADPTVEPNDDARVTLLRRSAERVDRCESICLRHLGRLPCDAGTRVGCLAASDQ